MSKRWTLLTLGLGMSRAAPALTGTAGTSTIPIYAYDDSDRSLFGAAAYWYDPRPMGYHWLPLQQPQGRLPPRRTGRAKSSATR